MKTVTDVNTVNQLLTYSKQAEAGIHQKAIQMLLGAGNNKKQDSLSISDAARGFSKQSIAALIDKNANISNSELAYYFANYNNSSAILDAINFGENVSCGYNSDFKEYCAVDCILQILFSSYLISPYHSINYQLQKSEAFQSVHHVTFILCYTVL